MMAGFFGKLFQRSSPESHQFFRIAYIKGQAFVEADEVPTKCPECGGRVATPLRYGVTTTSFDPQTAQGIYEFAASGGKTGFKCALRCPAGHVVVGKGDICALRDSQEAWELEWQCVLAQISSMGEPGRTFLSNLEVPLGRVAPGLFVAKDFIPRLKPLERFVPPVLISSGCHVASNCLVGPLVLLHNTSVGPGARIARHIAVDSVIG